ncbi:MAG: hypothetical protein KAJ18_05740 [Candidatus Omnitrophica bacterium]|nr:hypothetical protein [Candidatus Omnitrophota bacterium]
MKNTKIDRIFTSPGFLLALSSCLWLFAFRDFLTSRLALAGDAAVYYEHIKYFLDNISRGVYPMWEPTRADGVPEEFFLRRIGSFNPLFFVILLLNKAGLPYTHAYLMFLGFYYLLGMSGFYLLAKRIFHSTGKHKTDKHAFLHGRIEDASRSKKKGELSGDARPAFVAYILLMFSSLGTRLFDSYILLVFVPMVWFFYFLVAFSQQQDRKHALGLTFSLMILVITYIPFYFVTIFLCFLLSFCLLYPCRLKSFLADTGSFIWKNKVLFFVCVCLLVLSLLPGVLFFLDSKTGEVVLPSRQMGTTGESSLAMTIDRATAGGLNESFLAQRLFVDQSGFQLGDFYIPLFFYFVLLAGAFVSIKKRFFFWGVWGGVLFVISFTDATPFYKFLYTHISYFKYFRNLEFFLWWLILPLSSLFCAEQLHLLLERVPETKTGKTGFLCLLFVVCCLALMFLRDQGGALASSYLVVGLSFVFFAFHFFGNNFVRRYGLLLLLVLVTAHPLEVYYHLSKNANVYKGPKQYRYQEKTPFLNMPVPAHANILPGETVVPEEDLRPASKRVFDAYIGTHWYVFLINYMPRNILDAYVSRKFLVYDQVFWLKEDQVSLKKLQQSFARNLNLAFVSLGGRSLEDVSRLSREGKQGAYAKIITKGSSGVQVLDFDINQVKAKTNFDTQKLLVYNDNFHKDWRVFIDGKETDLWRTNVAFKGVFVPAGEHVVHFRFGLPWRYFLNWFLLILFFGTFFFLITFYVRKTERIV